MEIEAGPERKTGWLSALRTSQRVMMGGRGAVALAGIVLLSLAFRLHVSRECSLWLDEVATHLAVLKPWHKLLQGPTPGHPPLMYALVKVATNLFGMTEMSLRSVSLLFGSLVLVALYELCLELELSARRSLIVVATFALVPFFIRHATEARHYAMLTAFCTLAATRTLRLLRGPPRLVDLVGFALSVVAAAATHYIGLAYASALLAAVASSVALGWKQSSAYRRSATLSVLLLCLVPLGYLARRAVGDNRVFGIGKADAATQPAVDSELLREIAREFSFLTNELWSFVLEPALALVGFVLLTRRLRGVARLVPVGLGLAPCVAALLLPAQHFFAPRYLAPSAVFYHLGACVTVMTAVDRVRLAIVGMRSLLWLAPHLGALVLALMVATRLAEHPDGFGIAADDYRGLQRYFMSELQSDTALVTFPGFFGKLLMHREYKVDKPPIPLERFRPVRGIDRYLVLEINCNTPERRAELESLIEPSFGISVQQWRSLPLVAVPHSIYQPPVVARLVQLPNGWAPPRRKNRRHRKPPAAATPRPRRH